MRHVTINLLSKSVQIRLLYLLISFFYYFYFFIFQIFEDKIKIEEDISS